MSATQGTSEILIAGGCHVEGWPVGDEFSFGVIAAQAIGAEPKLLGYISLRNPSKLIEYLRRQRRPDILVLQLGNYEAPIPIQKHFRAVLKLKPKRKPDGGQTASSEPGQATSPGMTKRPAIPVPPERTFQPNWKWHAHMRLKQVYAAAGQVTRPQLFDAEDMRRRLRSVFEHLAPLEIPQVVALAPLPCPDPMARNFRRAAGLVFRQECERAGVVYLDSFSVLGYGNVRPRRDFDIYSDAHHLNAVGQRMLADALIPMLLSAKPVSAHPPAHSPTDAVRERALAG
jgi:hypothetical protein